MLKWGIRTGHADLTSETHVQNGLGTEGPPKGCLELSDQHGIVNQRTVKYVLVAGRDIGYHNVDLQACEGTRS